MATKFKRQKAAERHEADRVFSMLLLLEASDYRAAVPQYFFSDNMVATGVTAEYDRPPTNPGGLLLKAGETFGPSAMEVVECEAMTPAKLDSLRLWWQPVVGAVPDELCRVSAAVVHTHTGRVLASRRDYRHHPHVSDGHASAWFAFPPMGDFHLDVRRRQTSGGSGSKWETYTSMEAEKNGLSNSCALAVGFIAWADVAAERFWSVSFTCRKTGVAIRLFTDTDGVTGFYNLRDVGESGRRDALTHWVRQHTRRLKQGGTTEVVKHLRGKDSFRWFGFDARVHLPTRAAE